MSTMMEVEEGGGSSSEMATEEEEKKEVHEEVVSNDVKEEEDKEVAEENEVAADKVVETGAEAVKEEEVEQDEKKEEKKKPIVDWPLRNIDDPHDNDVLYGRGGGTNHHPGNKRYRKIVEDRKLEYVNCKRLDKPLVALSIIRDWRSQNPPGRFLKIDERTGLWNDVGDKKAREKTSQALREKAPLIRKQQEEEEELLAKGDSGEGDSDDEERGKEGGEGKTTRFAEGTNMESTNKVQKAILERDHSLGREYLDEGEAIALDGFSWQDPFQNNGSARPSTRIPERTKKSSSPPEPPPPPRMHGYHDRSQGTSSMESEPYRYSSQGSLGPPPPPPGPEAYAHMTSSEHYRYHSQGRYESWGSLPPPPPMPGGYGYPQHSGSSWGGYRDPSGRHREHSLGQNPLPHASIGQPAHYSTFDSRTGSWGPPHHPHPYAPPPPGYAPGYQHSGGPPPHHQAYPPPPPPPPPPTPVSSRPHPPPDSPPRRKQGPPSPPYSLDPAVASAWSGQDPTRISTSWSGGSGEDYDRERKLAGNTGRPSAPSEKKKTTISDKQSEQSTMNSDHLKPEMIKRATSNQNETVETKPGLQGPSVKRAALNRDNSLASNTLKEKYIPGYPSSRIKKERFNAEREMRQLSMNLEQSTLEGNTGATGVRPNPLSYEDKMTTIDQIAMDLMVKPLAFSASGRSTTIEALALDLELDSWVKPESIQERSRTMEEVFEELRGGVQKPSSLAAMDRLTTDDFLDMVNEPIGEDDELFSPRRNDKPFGVSRESSLGEWVQGV